MSNTKPIDKDKKSNIKCEHCGNYHQYHCLICGFRKSYWNRCRKFAWDETKNYKEVNHD